MSLQKSDQSGRPCKMDNDVLRLMLENNLHLRSRDIAEDFAFIIQLFEVTLNLLDKLITGDEKWILYENIKRNCNPGTSSATVPKPSIHQQKVLLCLWWARKGPVNYELLKQGKTINADLYCNQLGKINATVKEKDSIIFQKRNSVPPR
ncbi:mariner Mos1 transposase [Trichonephila clavipes]|nr:mariner Mos1 transposase [Trichonephila clavipes]